MTKQEFGKAAGATVGAIMVGMMLGLLIVLVMLSSIGALDDSPGINPIPNVNPFGDGPISGTAPQESTATPDPDHTPTPTPTPTPWATPDDEERFEERKKWDSRKKLNPGNGQNQREKIIETSKKKRRIKDDDHDGVLEHRVKMYPVGDEFGVGFTHQCCDCALQHLLTIQTTTDDFGFPALVLRWERLDNETEVERRRKWGPRWRSGGPFPEMGADPFAVGR